MYTTLLLQVERLLSGFERDYHYRDQIYILLHNLVPILTFVFNLVPTFYYVIAPIDGIKMTINGRDHVGNVCTYRDSNENFFA